MASPSSSPTKVRFPTVPISDSIRPDLPPSPADARAPMVAYVLTPPLSTVNLNHFRLLRVVGKGAFGKVRIVERKDTGLTFALKYIRKDEGQHMSRGANRRPTAKAYMKYSGTVGERAEYHQGAEDAGTSQSCLPVQLAVQLSGHRIFVSLHVQYLTVAAMYGLI